MVVLNDMNCGNAVKEEKTVKPVRIAYVNGGLMDRGGISSVIMDYWRNMDSSKVQVDFIGHGTERGSRDEEIVEAGGKVTNVIPKSVNVRKNVYELKSLFVKGRYDIVHAHADTGNMHILRIAKSCGIPVRISHSHNSGYTVNKKIQIILNNIQKIFIPAYATELWACSNLAGRWLYGKKEFKVIHNAIHTDKYVFSEEKRNAIRAIYGISDEILIGAVGKLEKRKNHSFLIRALEIVLKQNDKYKLMIVGNGDLKNELHQMVREKGLEDKVLFIGEINDVNEYYSAFDIYAMPSLFEGFPISAIEAQCSGLPCLFSENITNEVSLMHTNKFLSINSLDLWSQAILEYTKKARNTSDAKEILIRSGYDINHESKKMEQEYIKLVNNNAGANL